jgi:predicted NAD/FAD-binding protein
MVKQRIAVVGSGIAGLSAAWLLSRRHEVHLFERRERLGGHTHTVIHENGEARVPLDTGFIVYNEVTYPNLTQVLARLGVATQASDMSFAVSCRRPDLEYSGSSLRALLAQPGNILRPWYLRMLVDIWRFGRIGRQMLEQRPDPTRTLGDLVSSGSFGEAFGKLFLLPMAAAIWSTGTGPTTEMPRDTLLRFFANHGLLKIKGQPQWRTVVGGSSSYISRMTEGLSDRIRLGCGVERIERHPGEVVLHLADGSTDRFDLVVIAAHADQALAMLAEPTPLERELLGAWRYSDNETWLHTDTTLLPRRRAAWASWCYLIEDAEQPGERVCVSYYLNRLQRIAGSTHYVVTLNPPRAPRDGTVIRRMHYRHPVYDRASVATQERLPLLNGSNRTFFCGAYLRYGFHEDGLVSAMRVADELGAAL